MWTCGQATGKANEAVDGMEETTQGITATRTHIKQADNQRLHPNLVLLLNVNACREQGFKGARVIVFCSLDESRVAILSNKREGEMHMLPRQGY